MTTWDSLSHHFDLNRPNPDPGVAANLTAIWPALEPVLRKLPEGSRVLDFGCGTGGLCKMLHSMGFAAYGTDTSAKMIEVARNNSPSSVTYWVDTDNQRWPDAKYSLITSSMVFQFIADLPAVLIRLRSYLSPEGVLWFSVHNERYVTHSMNSHTSFSNFTEQDGLRTAAITLSNVPVLTYIRSAEDYEQLCLNCGFQKLSHWESPLFADGTPPKYLVQSYRLG